MCKKYNIKEGIAFILEIKSSELLTSLTLYIDVMRSYFRNMLNISLKHAKAQNRAFFEEYRDAAFRVC